MLSKFLLASSNSTQRLSTSSCQSAFFFETFNLLYKLLFMFDTVSRRSFNCVLSVFYFLTAFSCSEPAKFNLFYKVLILVYSRSVCFIYDAKVFVLHSCWRLLFASSSWLKQGRFSSTDLLRKSISASSWNTYYLD